MRFFDHLRFLLFPSLLALVSVTSACNFQHDPQIAKVYKAVRVFDVRFNAAQFHEIYLNADVRLQRSVNESDFSNKLNSLLHEHGPIQEVHMNGFDFDYRTRWQRLLPDSRTARFVGYYNTCKNGGFQSLFTFDVTGDEAKLLEFETSLDDANRKLKH